MLEWTDITTYSRDQDREPRTWERKVGSLRLVVTRRLGLSGWFADCPPFLSYRALGVQSPEAAQVKAAELLRAALRTTLEALDA